MNPATPHRAFAYLCIAWTTLMAVGLTLVLIAGGPA